MKPAKLKGATNTLRIIGGQWRGRKLSFVPAPGLRPTLDRLRETLFNWLMFDIEGRTCLDLYSGSGALGLEALSRGARHVSFIELNPQSAEQIKHHLQTLNCNAAQVYCADVAQWLQHSTNHAPYDVVFMDPPFHQDMLASTLERLLQSPLLNPHACVYVECEPEAKLPELPSPWQIRKEKTLKNKRMLLIQRG